MHRAHSPHSQKTASAVVGYNTIVKATLLLRLMAVCVLLLGPLAAHAQTTPRGAEHDGFGRMVFDWDGPLKWSADLVDGQLVVRFEKPIAGDPKVLLKAVDKYLKALTLSPDRRMVTFTLTQPVTLKTFVSGTSTVIDLQAAKTPPPTPAKPPEPAKPESAKPESTKASESKPVESKPEPMTDIMVRGGEHTGFNRLVFDWPRPVGYAVNTDAGNAVIAFDRPAATSAKGRRARAPPWCWQCRPTCGCAISPAAPRSRSIWCVPPVRRRRRVPPGRRHRRWHRLRGPRNSRRWSTPPPSPSPHPMPPRRPIRPKSLSRPRSPSHPSRSPSFRWACRSKSPPPPPPSAGPAGYGWCSTARPKSTPSC
jgi:hypothetical protein